MTRILRLLAVPALVAAIVPMTACQESAGPSASLQPTVIEPPSQTDTFTGSVPAGGSNAWPFSVSQVGTVSITLTTTNPPTITMGLGVGNPSPSDATVCQLIPGGVTSTKAGTTPQLSGPVSQLGAYCVAVFALGTQTDAVTYSLTVTHPK